MTVEVILRKLMRRKNTRKIMKIYFAGSIRGGRDDEELYRGIIRLLEKYGKVLTEHVGNGALSMKGEQDVSDKYIYKRDMSWLREADVVIAEVTTSSLGVGYEIGKAEGKKRILCLYREQDDRRLSAMIAGNENVTVATYSTGGDLGAVFEKFFGKSTIKNPRNHYGGKFIVFEGLDGSGQSTQARLLKEYFEKQNEKVFLTKEPTQTTEAGKKIKEVLEEKIKIDPLKLQKLFVADRAEHLKKEIIPSLKRGEIVISDRYFFSTLAFGGLDVPMERLIKLNGRFIYPDKVIFLKVRPKICLERIEKRGEGVRFFEKLDKLKKILKNYQEVIRLSDDIVVVNGEKGIKEIHQKIKFIF